MSTYKEIFGKPIKVLSGDPNPTPITYTVTVADPGSGNKYYIDGVLIPTLELYEGNTYNFDYSGASSHPFRFSATSDGTHNSGTEYTDGVSVDSNITTIVVPVGAPTLYYYCSSHSGMGGTALTPAADSTLEGQIWYNETLGKFRSVVMTGAFSSGGNLNVGRYAIGSAGTFTAGLAIGGDLFPNPPGRGSNSTEEYNGTSWATGGNLGTSASWRAGAGTQTAASGTAGNNYSSYISTSENYDGSSWTSATSAPYAAEGSVSTGSRPASIWGGGGSPPGAYPNTFFYGDGEGWTAITASNNSARYAAVFTGTQTAALLTGGHSPQSSNTETWDGSSWSNETAFPNILSNGGGNRVGTSTSGVVAGGTSTAAPGQNLSSTHWDGTSWAADAALSVAKTSSTSAGTQNKYYVAGAPNPGSAPGRASTEEYEKTIYSPIAATWSSGGNLATARNVSTGAGVQTAALMIGGNNPGTTQKGETEEYDGTSYSEQNDLTTARSQAGSGGTTSAAVLFGGDVYPSSPRNTNKTEEYNGSSWSEQNDMAQERRALIGFGTQTAAVGAAGYSTTILNNTEEYNGSSWTTGNTMPVAKESLAGAGTLTAGLTFGGYAPPGPGVVATTEEYDGTNWSSGGALNTGRWGAGRGTVGPQSACLAFGGDSSSPAVQSATEAYDGTSWSTRPSLATARRAAGGAGTQTANLCSGGYSTTIVNTTEEFSGEVPALDYKSISSS